MRIWRDSWIPKGVQKTPTKRSRLRWVSRILPDNKSWNKPLIRSVMQQHHAEEILKIRLPNYSGDDLVAWFPEKFGNFTVRSAYKLALDLQNLDSQTGSSVSPGGDRSLWNLVCKAPVLPKVRMFAWKLATNSLAVQQSRSRRLKKEQPTCSICGMEEEDGFHEVIRCTKAKALRDALRVHWSLPEEHDLLNSGCDWVLVLLANSAIDVRRNLLLFWRRTWFLRNDVIFGKGDKSINDSANFLLSLQDDLDQTEHRCKPRCR